MKKNPKKFTKVAYSENSYHQSWQKRNNWNIQQLNPKKQQKINTMNFSNKQMKWLKTLMLKVSEDRPSNITELEF